jgi:hypothetical protein
LSEDPLTRREYKRLRLSVRAGIGAVFCWAVIATFGIAALGINTIRDHQALDKATRALNQSATAYAGVQQNTELISINILHACIRLNIVRAEDNTSHYGDYLVTTQQIKFQSASLRSNYIALQRIGIPKKILDRALAQSEASLKTERIQAESKSWVPLTNCTAVALSTGGTYKPPAPISFTRGKPPTTALNFTNAALADPVGSLP